MSKILRLSDRIRIKVGDVSFTIAPLNQFQKIEISEQTKMDKGGSEVFDLARAQTLLVKYGLKDIEGVKDANGDDYKLEFDGDCLSDDCVSEVFTIPEKSNYVTAHFQCLNEYPDKLVNPLDGKKLKGVALELVTKKKAPE
jgi:hypothetical protein